MELWNYFRISPTFTPPPAPVDVDADGDGLIDIQTLAQLNNVRYNLAGSSYRTSATDTGNASGYPAGVCTGYELLNDIDASLNTNWKPIGTPSNRFRGTFDGNGYKIENLTINRSDENYVGLFAYVDSGASIKNVGLANVSIRGGQLVGGLAGSNRGAIENSYVSGTVIGMFDSGGLVGKNWDNTSIKRSFSTASVTGTGNKIGGLVGFSTGVVEGSYWDTQTSGQTSSRGGIGKTTAELKASIPDEDIFTNWDTAIWNFGTTSEYPRLIIQESR